MTLLEVVTIGIACLSLLLNFGIALVGATWGISKIRITVAQEMEAHRLSVDDRLEAGRQALEDKMLRSERGAGEALAAMRQKMHEMEVWVRDNLEPKGAAEAIIDRYSELVNGQLDKIDRRLERMESKIDKAAALD